MVFPYNEIIFIVGSGRHSIVHYADNTIKEIPKSLSIFACTLENIPEFARVHQSYIVNLTFMTDYIRKKQ